MPENNATLTAARTEPDPPVRVEQWAIYDCPDDAPGRYVARSWVMTNGHVEAGARYICDTLNDARVLIGAMSPCTYVMPRQCDDEAPLVEVWQ